MDSNRAVCRYQSPNGRGRCPARQDTAIEESFSGLVSREEGGEEKGGHQRAAKEIQKWMLEWKWREGERERKERERERRETVPASKASSEGEIYWAFA